MIIKQQIEKRICDICKIEIKNKDNYTCIICGNEDLCRECRIKLTQTHKNIDKYKPYQTKNCGFICIDCLKKLGEKNGNS